jgi:histone deacetylase 1/2
LKEGKRNGRQPKVLYLDLDFHFGDGVAKAFQTSRQVLTLSVHHASPTFFPQTLAAQLPTPDTANLYSLAVPLGVYPTNATYTRVFEDCIEPIKQSFDPDFVVLQLGADGLPNDRVGEFGAWTIDGDGSMAWCVQKVKDWRIPLCVLGGGGYDHANTARAWAMATSVLLDESLQHDAPIPDHSHFTEYGPGFTMTIPPCELTGRRNSTDRSLQQRF